MYLAKFFRGAAGRDDRVLLLILGGEPTILGLVLDADRTPFERRSTATEPEAVDAFRARVAGLLAEGHVETADTDYTLAAIPPGSGPKPDWQKALDDLFLDWRAGRLAGKRAAIDQALAGPAGAEPFARLLAAMEAILGATPDLARAEAEARRALASWPEADEERRRRYVWSLASTEATAMMWDALGFALYFQGRAEAALDAFERGYDAAADADRGGRIAQILAFVFPEHRELAFDKTFRWGGSVGYDAVEALDAYRAYRAERTAPGGPLDGWRWSSRTAPASPADVARIEADLGAPLPRPYRDFLLHRGRTELIVRAGTKTAGLRFPRPDELPKRRAELEAFITRTDPEAARRRFRESYDVDLGKLLPVAEPWDRSSAVLLHAGDGVAHGRVYLWDHDDAWILETAWPDLETALAAFTAALAARDAEALRFVGIWPD